MTEQHRDEWVSYCPHVNDDGSQCECAPVLVDVVAALERAHEQLRKFDYKGPKQIGRALMTIEAALPRTQVESEEDT